MVAVGRRELKKELTRQALLSAAAGLFADHGYDETTIDDIVARASVAKVTFYYYFKSKEELVLAIKAALTDEAVAAAEALLNSAGSAEEVLRSLARDLSSRVEKQRSLFAVIFQQRFSPLMTGIQAAVSAASKFMHNEGICSSSNFATAGNTASKKDNAAGAQGKDAGTQQPAAPSFQQCTWPRLYALVENIIVKGQDTGEFRLDFTVHELSHHILSNITHEQFMWISQNAGDGLEKRMDKRIDLLLGGLSTTFRDNT